MLAGESGTLSFREVVALWRDNPAFGCFFTSLLKEHPFEAFFWECPPVTVETQNKDFEFVLVESGALPGLKPDASTFKSQFMAQKSKAVIAFPNLGGDAVLVVPAPIAEPGCYTHLAQFVRRAPGSQLKQFWETVGLQMQQRVSDEPVWLSTAGLGVSWLHLRLDSRPKYYRHEPYKQPWQN